MSDVTECSSLENKSIRILETHHIYYNMEKTKIEQILKYILTQRCGFKVFGYNKFDDNYYCKTMKKCICTFFVNISIHSQGVGKSIVSIRENYGEKNVFKAFVDKFMDAMKLYVESPFVYEYLKD